MPGGIAPRFGRFGPPGTMYFPTWPQILHLTPCTWLCPQTSHIGSRSRLESGARDMVAIVEAGAAGPLIELLRTGGDQFIRARAAWAIFTLVYDHSRNAVAFFAAGAVRALLDARCLEWVDVRSATHARAAHTQCTHRAQAFGSQAISGFSLPVARLRSFRYRSRS